LTKELKALQLKTIQIDQLPKASTSLFNLLTGNKALDMDNAQKWVDELTAFLKVKENRFKVRALLPELFHTITLKYENQTEVKSVIAVFVLLTGSTFQVQLDITGARQFNVSLL